MADELTPEELATIPTAGPVEFDVEIVTALRDADPLSFATYRPRETLQASTFIVPAGTMVDLGGEASPLAEDSRLVLDPDGSLRAVPVRVVDKDYEPAT